MLWTERPFPVAAALLLALALLGLPALAHPPADEALADLAARIAADPSDPHPYLERAALLGARGDTQAALADCTAARDRFPADDPERPLVDLVAGQALLADGRAADALPRLDAFLAARPRHAPALVARARALQLLDRTSEAIAGYRRALDAAPLAGPDLHLELARALRAAGRPSEALDALRDALRRLGPAPALTSAARDLAAALGAPPPAPTTAAAPDAAAPSPAPLPSHPGAPRRDPRPLPPARHARQHRRALAHRRALPPPRPLRPRRWHPRPASPAAAPSPSTTRSPSPASRPRPATPTRSRAPPTPPAPSRPSARRPPPAPTGPCGSGWSATPAPPTPTPAPCATPTAPSPPPTGPPTSGSCSATTPTPPAPRPSTRPPCSTPTRTSSPRCRSGPPSATTTPSPRTRRPAPAPTTTSSPCRGPPRPAACPPAPRPTTRSTTARSTSSASTPRASDRSPGGAMLAWLRADLAAASAPWIVAYWHHPPYTKGSHDSDAEPQLAQMRERFLPVLEAHGVDLVLTGHSHAYERSFLIDGHYGPSDTLAPSMVLDGGDGRPGGDGAYEKPNVGRAARGRHLRRRRQLGPGGRRRPRPPRHGGVAARARLAGARRRRPRARRQVPGGGRHRGGHLHPPPGPAAAARRPRSPTRTSPATASAS